jgi:hypothetical protein
MIDKWWEDSCVVFASLRWKATQAVGAEDLIYSINHQMGMHVYMYVYMYIYMRYWVVVYILFVSIYLYTTFLNCIYVCMFIRKLNFCKFIYLCMHVYVTEYNNTFRASIVLYKLSHLNLHDKYTSSTLFTHQITYTYISSLIWC